MHFQNFVDFLWYLLMEAKWFSEDVALLVPIVQTFWTNWNDVIHGGKRKNGKQLLQWCQQYLSEYWARVEVPVKDHQVLESKWLPLIEPSYKVNVDGAIFESQKEVGVGL